MTLVFIVIMIALFYVGGKNRIREERALIEKSNEKEMKMAAKAKA